MQKLPRSGLIAATFSPFTEQGDLNLSVVPARVEELIQAGISGLYVCGSTGEGPSLETEERRAVAEAYVSASAGRVPVIVQVGCESLRAAAGLAAHAQEIGADGVSAVPPVYFKPQGLSALVDTIGEVASAAPNLPFLYYHIPALSGIEAPGRALLELAAERVPSFGGIKYTAPTLDDFEATLRAAGDSYGVHFGRDEMMLAALAVGATSFIGSTYNLIAPVYLSLISSFESGDLEAARGHMARAQALIELIPCHGRGSQKGMMGWLGRTVGPVRAPLESVDTGALAADMEALGVRSW